MTREAYVDEHIRVKQVQMATADEISSAVHYL